MRDAKQTLTAGRWSSKRRFVQPIWVERLASGTLAVALAGAGVGVIFIPGLSIWVGLIVAVVACALGMMLVRASNRTFAETITRIEIEPERIMLVMWNGSFLQIERERFIESKLGEYRSASRPGVPYSNAILTIHWRDEQGAEQARHLRGPWEPALDEIHERLLVTYG